MFDQYQSVIVKMKVFVPFLVITSIPLSLCLAVPGRGQNGISKSIPLDIQEDRHAVNHELLEAQQHNGDTYHNSTVDLVFQQVKREQGLMADFHKWLADRGGIKEGEYEGELMKQFQESTGIRHPDMTKAWPKGPDLQNRTTLIALTDQLIFDTDQFVFQDLREKALPFANDEPGPYELDWKSDACTGMVNNPWGFDFKAACQRNDFAITNTVRQKRYTPCMQKRISARFSHDMERLCHRLGVKGICDISRKIYIFTEEGLWRPKPTGDCFLGEPDTDYYDIDAPYPEGKTKLGHLIP